MASVRARVRAQVPAVTVAAEFEQADCWTTPRRQKTHGEPTSEIVSGGVKEWWNRWRSGRESGSWPSGFGGMEKHPEIWWNI